MDLIEILPTSDPQELRFLYRADYDATNLLRRSIISEIPCYAVDNCNFLTIEGYVPASTITPEDVASRLGQCPLVQSELPTDPETKVYHLEVVSDQGIRRVTTRDIANLPFVEEFEIVKLKAGEYVCCDIRLKKSTPREHMKYLVTSLVGVEDDPEGHILTCELTGQYDARDVIRMGLEGMDNTLTDVGENMFYLLAPSAHAPTAAPAQSPE